MFSALVTLLLLLSIALGPRQHQRHLCYALIIGAATGLIWLLLPLVLGPASRQHARPDHVAMLAAPRALREPNEHVAQQYVLQNDREAWLRDCGQHVADAADLLGLEGGYSRVYATFALGNSDDLLLRLAVRPDHELRPSVWWPEGELASVRAITAAHHKCHPPAGYDDEHDKEHRWRSWTRRVRCFWYTTHQLPYELSDFRALLADARNTTLPHVLGAMQYTRRLIDADLDGLEQLRTRLSTDTAELALVNSSLARAVEHRTKGTTYVMDSRRAVFLLSLLHSARLHALRRFLDDDIELHFLLPFRETLDAAHHSMLHILQPGGRDALLAHLDHLVRLEADMGAFPPSTADATRVPYIVPPRLHARYVSQWLVDFWNTVPPSPPPAFPPPPPPLLYQLQQFWTQSIELDPEHWQSYWHHAPLKLDDPALWCDSVVKSWAEKQELRREGRAA
ncbi:hypothetical protein Slin15195_G129250 [Septoria linicola]|uniref:Uncharacterized protein n=1 Tax=Septoria linicola TaxID=215465 RepID=A0A9Q9BAY9_9PEZI|nr:hypothetical protein Slin14017_G121780 [Septoria linicola]USW59606.1 hypothetical protein Slin15195_G129250 [Septoria linicola]